MDRLVLGSRGSALALAQVEIVKKALREVHAGLPVEVKIITTSGDRRQEVKAGEGGAAGLKGLFTKEIQDALLDGSIDAAVHSLKDLPGVTPGALVIGAVLPRADASDLLISRARATLADLPAGARLGTSSVRRRRQVEWLRSGLEIVELRGNVPTRLEKLAASSFDAIVLARAGLDRLGYTISEGVLRCDSGVFRATKLDILPAIGQGAIGLEARGDDRAVREILSVVDHVPSHICIRVERELLRLLDGDCRLPVGARAIMEDATIHADAVVFPDDEAAPPVMAHATGPASDPEALARDLFDQIENRKSKIENSQ